MLMKTMRLDGGVETSVASIVNELYLQSHDVFIASFSEKEGDMLKFRLNIPNNKIIYLGNLGNKYISKIYILRRILRKGNFDIIHTHLFHAGVVGRVATAGLRCSTVATEHSTFFNWWRWYHYMIDKILSHKTASHIAVSRSVAATLAARTGILPNKIIVINNAVDTSRFRFKEESESNKSIKNILLVGRLEYSKNIDFAIKIFKKLLLQNPSITLTISGSGSQKRILEDICSKEYIAENIKFIGVVKDMPLLMRKMDALFLSSHWEGCPMTIIEAFSTGLPVIATSVPGIIDIVSDKITGILLKPNDIEGSVNKISEFLKNQKLQKEIIENAKKESLEFTPQKIINEIINVYTSIIKS